MINRRKMRRHTVSIKYKLILIYLPIAIIPMVIFAFLISSIYDEAMTKRTLKSVEDSNIVIADRITRVLTDSENCANYLTVNINRIVSSEYQKAANIKNVVVDKLITNELNSAQVVFKEIESIAYVNNRKVYYSDYRLMNNVDKIKKSEYFKQLVETTGNSIWFKATVRDYLVTNKEEQVLTLGKKIISTISGETLGYLFVNVDKNEITKHLKNQLIQYWLVDDNHNTVSAIKDTSLLQGLDAVSWLANDKSIQFKKINGNRYLLSKYKLGGYNWSLLGITNLDEYNVEAKEYVTFTMVAAFSAIFLIIILSIVLTTIITAPLRKLKLGAEQIAEGNLNIRFHFKTEDEIGQLGKSFNFMSQRVSELLQKVDYEARKKREYELSLLQQQVKPHFLYNTLDIIIKLSEMNKSREAQRVAKKLADYYRGSLSNRKEIITIAEEIQITKDYLDLQKMRYYDLFEYEVEIDKEIEDKPILKLTLQPLVENAIYHGLKYKESAGKISIRGRVCDTMIELIVEDNGIGMKQEFANIEDIKSNSDEHFGVYSVHHRIQLYFGEQYGLEFHSDYGLGTEIKVILPRNV